MLSRMLDETIVVELSTLCRLYPTRRLVMCRLDGVDWTFSVDKDSIDKCSFDRAKAVCSAAS